MPFFYFFQIINKIVDKIIKIVYNKLYKSLRNENNDGYDYKTKNGYDGSRRYTNRTCKKDKSNETKSFKENALKYSKFCRV